ncbi:MAG: single-stranded-DNA-specific exonuclease RecJ [Spirochaetaceae bacterium]|nr:single-stranded-DNA-specific exonuclease RecJ [Spirochaetaceae bacterium]
MKWNKKDAPAELVKEISARYGCDLITASILIRRGITTPEALLYFLESDRRYMRSPFVLPGMEDAVERILAAKEEGERVLVFGDRDTDGITSIALLAGFLQRNNVDVRWKLPQGDEPYGLAMDAVEEFARDSGTLIITVDCGISNFNEIKRANELNIDVIVTDHHRPHEILPDAYTIVNPKVKTEGGVEYPFQELAGCGVAYKLVSALRFALKSSFYGHSICFMNVEPASDDTWVIDILKTRNLTVIDRLTEVIVPGTVSVSSTRLPAFLEGQQIFVYDAARQKNFLEKIFGRGVEFGMFDCAEIIAQMLPQTTGKSLLRLKEVSRIAHYTSQPLREIDVLFNLFVSFVQKKEQHHINDDDDDIQLAAIGTIADLMPLQDENRIIVRSGIAALLAKARPGISDLLYKQNLTSRNLSSVDISWQLTPVINAAGRLGEPDIPVKLLLTQDRVEREKLVTKIIELNEQRRRLADSTWDEKVLKRAEENSGRFAGKLVFADGNDIKRGVTGVMANRLTNKYHLPALILAYNEDIATGSMRSMRGYDLQGILDMGKDLFIDSGGHDYAAGFSLALDKVPEFLERLESFSSTIELVEENDIIEVDAELPLQYLTPEILKVIDTLEPFGKGHRDIYFIAHRLLIADISYVGKVESKHVKFMLDTGKYKWPALYWGGADRVSEEFKIGDAISAVFSVRRNFFNGMETPQMVIADIEKTGS